MALIFSLIPQETGFTPEYLQILKNAFGRKLSERGCELDEQGYPVYLNLSSSMISGEYSLTMDNNSAHVTAGNLCAVFAGLGEFLLGWRFRKSHDKWLPDKNIHFVPERSYRGLYFATHFYNFYHTAPMNEVLSQVEDVAFRGGNVIAVWYDMHHFNSFEDKDSLVLVKRLKQILTHAHSIGMYTTLTMLSNEAFQGTPDNLKASSVTQNGYHAVLDGHYGVEICPSKDHGIEEILRQRRIVLRGFADCKPDFVTYWPYDQGGCTCKDCAPWGTNGFVRLYPYFEKVIHEEFPGTRIIVSTWNFDLFIDGEWERFYQLLDQGIMPEPEYLMDFFYRGSVPACIEQNGLPAGKKMISFPEISMYGGKPWGGFGANPLPAFLQKTNDMGEKIYSGELCYSEGIFEDINKTIMLLSCSGREKDTREAIRKYASWEYMLEDADDIVRLAEMTEEALMRNQVFLDDDVCFEIQKPDKVQEAAELARQTDAKLPEPARSGWRWRILYLRTQIDEQILKDKGHITHDCDIWFKELNRYYNVIPESRAVICPPNVDVIHNKWLKNRLI